MLLTMASFGGRGVPGDSASAPTTGTGQWAQGHRSHLDLPLRVDCGGTTLRLSVDPAATFAQVAHLCNRKVIKVNNDRSYDPPFKQMCPIVFLSPPSTDHSIFDEDDSVGQHLGAHATLVANYRTLFMLPKDILVHILGFLTPEEQVVVMPSVCPMFKRICSQDLTVDVLDFAFTLWDRKTGKAAEGQVSSVIPVAILIAYIRRVARVRVIDVVKCSVDDSFLDAVAKKHPMLHQLVLGAQGNQTPRGVSDLLTRCTHLTHFKVPHFPECDEATLGALIDKLKAQCPNLGHVDLTNCHRDVVTDAVLKRLPNVASLRFGQLQSGQARHYTEQGLAEAIAGWGKMATLSIQSPVRSAETLAAIGAGCKGLTTLDMPGIELQDPRLTAEMIGPLASGCTSLTSLNLGKAVAITAEAVRTLASTCPQLTVLELTIFSHGDEMLSHVAQFSAKLESLTLNESAVRFKDEVATTGAGLVEVADQCLKLRRLLVIGFFDLTNTNVAGVITRAECLESLGLRALPRHDDAFENRPLTLDFLLELGPTAGSGAGGGTDKFRALTELDVSGCAAPQQVPSPGGDHLRQLQFFPSLRNFAACSYEPISPQGLRLLAASCPDLREIKCAAKCGVLNDLGIWKSVATKCPEIRTLRILWVRTVSSSLVLTVSDFRQLFPKLRTYQMR